MRFLAVEMAFNALSIAITDDEKVLVDYYVDCGKKTSAILIPTVEELLKNVSLTLADIDQYIVDIGPGSYTGIRISLSMMKTFAQVHQKPLFGIRSLNLLAHFVSTYSPFYVVLSCSRNDAFYSFYQNEDFSQMESKTPKFAKLEQVKEQVGHTPALFYQLPSRYAVSCDFENLIEIQQKEFRALDLIRAFQQQSPQENPLFEVQPLYIKKSL